jgi:N-methylhydantoinase A
VHRRVHVAGRWLRVPVFRREQLPRRLAGPALVLDYGATTLVPPGWTVALDRQGCLAVTSR